MRSQLKRAFDQDLPGVPVHWHTECDCVPTVAYIRVSRIGKRTNVKSPQIQLDEIILDAKRNHRRIVKIVFDLNVSGNNFDREALNEVVSDLQAGAYAHISVWKWSRWGRNLRGSLEMLATVEDLGACVDSATEPFEQGTVWGEFGRDQMLLIASLQGKVIGETWRSVHQTRRDNGLPSNGRKRFGYDYDASDERDKHYELNPDQAAILEWAYQAYVTGGSMRKITTEANARGARTEYGNEWTYQGFGKMMDSGFAAGLLRRRSPELIKSMKKRPANTLQSYDVWEAGKQPQIIDIGLWERYKARRLGQAKMPPKSRRAVHELSAILSCGICSRRLTTHYSGQQRQHRWHCESRPTHHPETAVSVSNEDALAVVKGWIKERAEPDWLAYEARKLFDRRSVTEPELDSIRKDLAKVERQLDRALDLHLAADDDDDRAKARILDRMRSLEQERDDLQRRLNSASEAPLVRPNLEAMRGVVDDWESYPKELHREALAELLLMVVVSPPSAPRVRSELRERVKPVGRWEEDEWADWFSARRHRSTW